MTRAVSPTRPNRFVVDDAVIERAYLAQARSVHPDFHQTASTATQQTSLEQTAILNEAYLTLREPLRRAEYLLKLKGGPSASEEKNLDQGFLAEMMDLRERLEMATSSHEKLELESQLLQSERERFEKVATLFEELDPLQPGNQRVQLSSIRQHLNAIKTIRSLLRDLNDHVAN